LIAERDHGAVARQARQGQNQRRLPQLHERRVEYAARRDGMNGLSLGNLSAQIFSPAKMVYIACILAVSLGKLQTNLCQLIIFSAVFSWLKYFTMIICEID
jgi:hypothetical protein